MLSGEKIVAETIEERVAILEESKRYYDDLHSQATQRAWSFVLWGCGATISLLGLLLSAMIWSGSQSAKLNANTEDLTLIAEKIQRIETDKTNIDKRLVELEIILRLQKRSSDER